MARAASERAAAADRVRAKAAVVTVAEGMGTAGEGKAAVVVAMVGVTVVAQQAAVAARVAGQQVVPLGAELMAAAVVAAAAKVGHCTPAHAVE
eukprot:5514395-Prymnesium_polylepis.1